jgi:nucleotidyltransferase substrate binding protein (TIGR01987 family)
MTGHPRWIQRFANYRRALSTLRDNCAQGSYSDLERSGLIQNFEVTFELAWHTLKDRLADLGHDVRSPKPAIRTAFDVGLVSDPEVWMDILDKSILFTHSYRDELARQAVQLIREVYLPVLGALEERLSVDATAEGA